MGSSVTTTEWILNSQIFANIIAQYGTPDIDPFASRLNHQIPTYVSWEPDPGAVAMDAFSLHWGKLFFYAFPLFLPHQSGIVENPIRFCIRDTDNTRLAHTAMVPGGPRHGEGTMGADS